MKTTLSPYVIPGITNVLNSPKKNPYIIECWENHKKLKALLTFVCDQESIEEEKILIKTRKRKIAEPRHIFLFLATNYTKCSYNTIKNFVKYKDHGIVNHAKKLCEGGPLTKKYNKIEASLRKFLEINNL